MNIHIVGYNSLLPEKLTSIIASSENDVSFQSGELMCNRASKFYPARSDEKIMREDVIASVIAVCEMLEKYTEFDTRNVIDLYVANGVFIEDTSKHMNKIMAFYQQIDKAATELEKRKKLYQATPPLLALQTLTNSTMSFIAQYANIKGNNTTFGNTSHSGYYAVEKALYSLQTKQNGTAVVCASNCGGIQSFLTFSTIIAKYENWKESSASACLLFKKAKSINNALCRISDFKKSKTLFSVNEKNKGETWQELLVNTDSDMIIFNGAFTENAYLRDQDFCLKLKKKCFSFFPQYGNLGSANVIMSIIKAIELLNDGLKKIDILDRDAYGRSCYLRIEK